MLPVNAETIRAIVPTYKGPPGKEQDRIISGIGPVLAKWLEFYGITTPLEIAHFLAQCAYESGGFRTVEEFASGTAYNFRKDLGNVQPGDGPRYKGRAFIMVTGRSNYDAMGKLLGLDLIGQPTLLNDPENALRASCAWWHAHNLNQYADADNIVEETQVINGGQNGIADRRTYLIKSKAAIAKLMGQALPVPATVNHPVLHRGSTGPEVVKLQQFLRDGGLKLAVDGSFGGATELAVTIFQQDNNLEADGIVGPATWEAIDETS